MWLVGVAVVAMVLGLGNAHAQQSRQKDPPFEVYLHTTTESGNLNLVVIYHQNGTFEMELGHAGGRLALISPNMPVKRMNAGKTGRWWWSADGKFCFQIEGRNPYCKANGHYIGQTPIS